MKRILLVGVAALMASMQFAAAEGIEGVEEVRDWTVYRAVSGEPECGVISRPRESVNTKNGKVAVVKRGAVLLAVTIDPTQPKPNYLVSYQSGYPFKVGSAVTMRVDSRSFTLQIGKTKDDAEWAWPPSDDQVIVDAMKKGNQAVLTATSRKDTDTKDTFSLLGITKALEVAEGLCSAPSS